MVLLDDGVEIFDLAHQDRHGAAGVDRIDRRLLRAALVHRDLVQMPVRSQGVVEEALRRSHVALRRQQEIDGLALLVDGAVEVFPDVLYLDVYASCHRPSACVCGPFARSPARSDRPSVDRGLVARDAALFHYLLDVPITQRISGVLGDADQDHVDRKEHTFEVEHVDLSWIWTPQLTRTACQRSLMRQNPSGELQYARVGAEPPQNCRGWRSAGFSANRFDRLNCDLHVIRKPETTLGIVCHIASI
jgi:hypothetical protein